MLVTRGLERVIGDLTALGYDTKWTVMGAADVGANHQRNRIWIVGTNMAYSAQLFSNGSKDNARISLESKKESEFGNDCWSQNVSNSNSTQRQRSGLSKRIQEEYAYACDSRWWRIEPDVGRMANGLASGMDRLKAIGNGQVPLCAATAWRLLTS